MKKEKTQRLKDIKQCDRCGRLSHDPDWEGVAVLGWRLCHETSFYQREPWKCNVCSCSGPTGATGPTGPEGVTGSTGPTGYTINPGDPGYVKINFPVVKRSAGPPGPSMFGWTIKRKRSR